MPDDLAYTLGPIVLWAGAIFWWVGMDLDWFPGKTQFPEKVAAYARYYHRKF